MKLHSTTRIICWLTVLGLADGSQYARLRDDGACLAASPAKVAAGLVNRAEDSRIVVAHKLVNLEMKMDIGPKDRWKTTLPAHHEHLANLKQPETSKLRPVRQSPFGPTRRQTYLVRVVAL
eukprot:359109-Chlamydomonas_euryale.AAC.3